MENLGILVVLSMVLSLLSFIIAIVQSLTFEWQGHIFSLPYPLYKEKYADSKQSLWASEGLCHRAERTEILVREQ